MTLIATDQLRPSSDDDELHLLYQKVRRTTAELAAHLPAEDQVVQSMDDVSPTRWHLAHTTWFFETFLLREFCDDYQVFHPGFDYLFNSYYQGAGPQFSRHRRGILGRPTVETIADWRDYVDEAVDDLFRLGATPGWRWVLEVGLHHEMQHQELVLTDIKHVLASNPLRPAYRESCALFEGRQRPGESSPPPSMDWLEIPGGIYSIGHEGDGFCFDNEAPRHELLLQDCTIANRPVSCGEFTAFLDDGGYDDPRLWLSLGWQWRQDHQINRPLYWEYLDDQWWTMTLGGMRPVDPLEPICHISYFEADAYARWRGATLPTEALWEVAATGLEIDGNLAERRRFHPAPLPMGDEFLEDRSFFGDVWEWTASPYTPYPGYQPWSGVVGEYNGKFMCNQFVLRGGSCVTPKDSLRHSYRNFFAPGARWQFSGLRLARVH